MNNLLSLPAIRKRKALEAQAQEAAKSATNDAPDILKATPKKRGGKKVSPSKRKKGKA